MQIETRPEKLIKADLVEKYKELSKAYDELECQYNDLDDCYAELERNADRDIEKLEIDQEWNYETLLRDVQSNTDFQNSIYEVFKGYYDNFTKLYCIDIPDEVYRIEKESKIDKNTNEKLIKVIEKYIEELQLYEDIKNCRR